MEALCARRARALVRACRLLRAPPNGGSPMVDCPQYPRPIELTWRRPGPALALQGGRPPFLLLLGLLCFSMPCIGINPHGTRRSECTSNLKSFYVSLVMAR